jgi:hypothetical protein
MAQVMTQGNCLSQVLIQVQGTGDGTGYLRDLEGMGQAGYIVVAQGGNKDLRLVLETAEGLGMDDAIPVALESGTDGAGLFRLETTPRLLAFRRIGGKACLSFFSRLTNIKPANH